MTLRGIDLGQTARHVDDDVAVPCRVGHDPNPSGSAGLHEGVERAADDLARPDHVVELAGIAAGVAGSDDLPRTGIGEHHE